RVRSAIRNSGFDLPSTRITINLAPADIKKEGSGFDLPMAVAILGAYGALQISDLSDYLFVGALGLDGTLRAVPGMLPVAIAARQNRLPDLVGGAGAEGQKILRMGPRGSGKPMRAKGLPTIQPPLTFDEALETTKIHSV